MSDVYNHGIKIDVYNYVYINFGRMAGEGSRVPHNLQLIHVLGPLDLFSAAEPESNDSNLSRTRAGLLLLVAAYMGP